MRRGWLAALLFLALALVSAPPAAADGSLGAAVTEGVSLPEGGETVDSFENGVDPRWTAAENVRALARGGTADGSLLLVQAVSGKKNASFAVGVRAHV